MKKPIIYYSLFIFLIFNSCAEEKGNTKNETPSNNDSIKTFINVNEPQFNVSETDTLMNIKVQSKDSNIQFFTRYYSELYENSYSRMMYLIMIQNGSPVWLVHPASDYGKKFPHKGIDTKSGTVHVNAPYESGILAYSGVFENNIAVGVHKSYTPNGKLKYSANYDSNIVTVYDSTGQITRIDSSYIIKLESQNMQIDPEALPEKCEPLIINE